MYHVSDIIKYEKISRCYIKKEEMDEDTPDPIVLIDYAQQEKKFNAGFVQYVIDRHLQNIVDYVYEKKRINVGNIHTLREDIYNNNVDEEACEKWLADCNEDNFCVNFIETLDVIMERNYIAMLYYFYYSEEKKLTDYLKECINKFNDRKFFIVQ